MDTVFWMPSVIVFLIAEKMDIKQVSVIIPTYKPQAYIWQCLDSVCCQDIGLDAMELIVVVNGCSQPYVGEIEQYLQGKSGLQSKVVQTDVPGVSNARNIGLSLAQGEWVCFIDDDDWVSENYIRNLVEAGGEEAHVVEANVFDYDEADGKYCDDYLTVAFRKNYGKSHVSLLSARSFMSSSCCKLIRREVIGHDKFDCEFPVGEDALFMAQISNRVRVIRIASPETVYYRRLRRGSASRKKRNFWMRLGDNVLLAKSYMAIYFSDIRHYNILFFCTRLLALARNCIR